MPATAVVDWNATALATVRGAMPAKFQIEGDLYMSYTQTAVYDAVTKIAGRYEPYHDFQSPVSPRGASLPAAVAAAAYTTLAYYFPAQQAPVCRGHVHGVSGGAAQPGPGRGSRDRASRGD